MLYHWHMVALSARHFKLDRPAADVSRGSSAHDILGVAAIIGVQSIAYSKLYPDSGVHLPGDER